MWWCIPLGSNAKKSKVKAWNQWITCDVAGYIGYWIHIIKWLEFVPTCISLEIGCIGVHVSWMCDLVM